MLIKLQNISKSYLNDAAEVSREVLKNIDFEADKKDLVSIIGPSGSGKSTLLNLMGTLDAPDSGNIFIEGTDVSALKINELAEIRNKKIGFVFQQHHLLPQLNVLENVLVPVMFEKSAEKKNAAQKRATELLEKVGLTDKLNQLPGQLSVGECQRTAVVRALINNPDILLADEPTGSLDEKSANQMVELLQSLNKELDIAIIMVTHSVELSLKFDRRYKLSEGSLQKLEN